MKKFLVVLTATMMSLLCLGQQQGNLKIAIVKKFNEEVKDFATDNLGNIYLLTAKNQIKKINGSGDSLGVYNDVKRYGKIYSINASNPLKILVYYKDFSTIIILDRLLNVRATIDLRKQNIIEVKAVTNSYDNNIWIFDELDSKLKKIDETGKVLFESTDFRQVFDDVPTPVSLYDRDGQLYLYDPKKGLLVLDYYGGKRNNFQLLNFTDLQVIDKKTITARNDSSIYIYNPIALQLLAFTPFRNQSFFKKINFNGNLLYCLTKKDELEIYQVLK